MRQSLCVLKNCYLVVSTLTVIDRTANVGRGHVLSRCRNYQQRTNLLLRVVCRFAVGGDMSPPYKGACGKSVFHLLAEKACEGLG